jgi:ornithine cyclodeaminase/alanine dehydrogenase-like protein (mu-crystallin family)
LLLLNNDDIRRVLTPAMTRRALEAAYGDLAREEAVCRPRIDVRIPTKTPGRFYQWGSMEGGSTAGYFAVRMKSDVVYERAYEGVRTQEKFCSKPGLYCGLIFLTDINTGTPLALINDGCLQHLRVAADGAIGTGVMARKGPATLGMLGSGGMARSHVAALKDVRDIRRIRVWSPTEANRRRFAAEMSEEHGVPVQAVDDPREVYEGADILASCTDSSLPVIRGAWLAPGMHVISIGGRPDDEARERFDVTLRFGTAPAPVGRPELGTGAEYLQYAARPHDPVWRSQRSKSPAVTDRKATVLLADILAGRARGRTSDAQITYSERGNIQGAQFYAVAAAAYEEARRLGIGREIPTEWFLQDIRD